MGQPNNSTSIVDTAIQRLNNFKGIRKVRDSKIEKDPTAYSISVFAMHSDKNLIAKKISDHIVKMIGSMTNPELVLSALTKMGLVRNSLQKNPFEKTKNRNEYEVYDLIRKNLGSYYGPENQIGQREMMEWRKTFKSQYQDFYVLNSGTILRVPPYQANLLNQSRVAIIQ